MNPRHRCPRELAIVLVLSMLLGCAAHERRPEEGTRAAGVVGCFFLCRARVVIHVERCEGRTDERY